MTVAEDNVTLLRVKAPASVPAQGGNGGGDDLRERLAALEERTKHLATSEKLEQVRTEVEQVKTEVAKTNTGLDYMKWILGLVAAGILLILGKLFFAQ